MVQEYTKKSSIITHTSSPAYCANLLSILSRTTRWATSAPCCNEIAPRMARTEVLRTTVRPEPSRFSGCGGGVTLSAGRNQHGPPRICAPTIFGFHRVTSARPTSIASLASFSFVTIFMGCLVMSLSTLERAGCWKGSRRSSIGGISAGAGLTRIFRVVSNERMVRPARMPC